MNNLDPKVRAFTRQPDLPDQDYSHADLLPHKTVSIQPKSWHRFLVSLSWGLVAMLLYATLQVAGCFDGSYQ